MKQIININFFFTDGITIHQAFNFKFDNHHTPLSDEQLAEFRHNLKDLKLIIIDEISLLSSDMLQRISMRLCEIFQSKARFANKAVCAVGDILQVLLIVFICNILFHVYNYNFLFLDKTCQRKILLPGSNR